MSARYTPGVWTIAHTDHAGDSLRFRLEPKRDYRRAKWLLDFEEKTAVTKIITRVTSLGCDRCRAALYVQGGNFRVAELPLIWEAGGGAHDGLQWLRSDAWSLAKVGPCPCTGECLTFEITTEPANPPPADVFCGNVMGQTMVYYEGSVGPKYA